MHLHAGPTTKGGTDDAPSLAGSHSDIAQPAVPGKAEVRLLAEPTAHGWTDDAPAGVESYLGTAGPANQAVPVHEYTHLLLP